MSLSILDEFKKFALRGNVIDLAVGVVIGAAFGKIVTSLVNDILMPPLGKLLGGVDFSQLYLNLGEVSYTSLDAAEKAGAPLIKYGVFINNLVHFAIIAFAIFLLVKTINRLQKPEPPAAPAEPPPTPEEIVLLREIRDHLKSRPTS